MVGGTWRLGDQWAVLGRKEDQPASACPASSPLRASYVQLLSVVAAHEIEWERE